MSDPTKRDENAFRYDGPTNGWRSLKGIRGSYGEESTTSATLETRARQNKTGGFSSGSRRHPISEFATFVGIAKAAPPANPKLVWVRP